MAINLALYSAGSFLVAIGMVAHAFYTREQFFPAMLYLSSSKVALVVLCNCCFVLLLLFGQLLKVIFFGWRLREAEVERLHEQFRNEVMEVCLAMTIFRQEFNVWFVAMFSALMFMKTFHWLTQKRVEYMETTPAISRLSHIRIVSFMLLLFAADCIVEYYSLASFMADSPPSVFILFAFEYFLLASTMLANIIKYSFYMVDSALDGQWEHKALCVYYLDLIRDLLHLIVYVAFFSVIFTSLHIIPLHLFRDLYETFRNFQTRVADFIRYRQITSNLNERFPDATPEELHRGDNTCIVCREEMTAAKKLPCGHLFHVHCLRTWLERQQTCPTCRAPLLTPQQPAAGAAGAGAGGGGAVGGGVGVGGAGNRGAAQEDGQGWNWHWQWPPRDVAGGAEPLLNIQMEGGPGRLRQRQQQQQQQQQGLGLPQAQAQEAQALAQAQGWVQAQVLQAQLAALQWQQYQAAYYAQLQAWYSAAMAAAASTTGNGAPSLASGHASAPPATNANSTAESSTVPAGMPAVASATPTPAASAQPQGSAAATGAAAGVSAASDAQASSLLQYQQALQAAQWAQYQNQQQQLQAVLQQYLHHQQQQVPGQQQWWTGSWLGEYYEQARQQQEQESNDNRQESQAQDTQVHAAPAAVPPVPAPSTIAGGLQPSAGDKGKGVAEGLEDGAGSSGNRVEGLVGEEEDEGDEGGGAEGGDREGLRRRAAAAALNRLKHQAGQS